MNKHDQPVIRRQRGFTLVELITVIVLLGILATVGSNMLSDSFTTTTIVDTSNAREAEARYALERLTREVREVRYTTGTGYSFNLASGSALQFVKTDGTVVNINYNTSASTNKLVQLYYGNASATTLVAHVNSFTLGYYDINGTALTTLAAIQTSAAFVGIALIVNNSTGTSTFAQSTRVALRNH